MLMPSMTKIIWTRRRISTLSMAQRIRSLARGIERIAHAVAQDVEGQHAEHDGDARGDRHPSGRV